MLMRFDPFRELDTVSEALRRRSSSPTMPMDAYRDANRFVVHFDLPGVDPDSIDLTVEKSVLSVHADRAWQVPQDREVVVNERPQGHFSRQLFLGEGLDPEQVEAFYDKGVLTLFIPIAEQAKPRQG